MRPWTYDENIGRVALNLLIRGSVAPTVGRLLPSQNAEFIRILAECFETSIRYAQLWTTLGTQRRPFIVPDQPEDICEQKIILALALTKHPDTKHGPRSFAVLTKGSNRNLEAPTLKTLLQGPYYNDELFHWDFFHYSFGNEASNTARDNLDFYLWWEYNSYSVPIWLPRELHPKPDGDPNPFPQPPATAQI